MDTLHFRKNEFSCSCCGEVKYNSHLVAILELVRIYFDRPVHVTSAYRCEEHNTAIHGAPKSQHLLGTAADIKVTEVDAAKVYEFLDRVFPESYGLGKYKRFTHIDVRGVRTRWNG